MKSCTIQIALPNGGIHFCQGVVDDRTGRTVVGNRQAEENLCGHIDTWRITGVTLNDTPFKPFPGKLKIMALAVAPACRWMEIKANEARYHG